MHVIQFTSGVNQASIGALIACLQQNRDDETALLLTCDGGDNGWARTGYEYCRMNERLKIYAVGLIHSSGIVLYCGGKERFSLPNVSFQFHPASFTSHGEQLTAQVLQEKLDIIKMDEMLYSNIVAEATKKTAEEIMRLIGTRAMITAHVAQTMGLAHAIAPALPSFPSDAQWSRIGPAGIMPTRQRPGHMLHVPPNQAVVGLGGTTPS